jgi:hypothetical protein
MLLAAVAAAMFLGPSLLPGRALVPYPPEHIPPLRSELAARGLHAHDLLVGNPTGGDKYNQSLAWDRIARDRLRQGEIPLWTRDLGGGAPVVPQMGQVYMPWTWLVAWFDSTTIYGPWFFLHQVLLGLLLYHFLRRLGVAHAAALFGLSCAVVGLWTQARVHHNVILSGALPLFWALSCVHALFHGGRWRATGLLAFAVGVPWLSGFAPVALQSSYLALAFAALCAAQAPPGSRRAPLLRVGIAFVLGGLIACPQMLPVLAATKDTARAAVDLGALRHNAMSWPHLLTAVWPDLLAWAQPAFYEGSLDNARIPFAALWLLAMDSARAMNWPETAFAVGVPGLVLALVGLRTRAHQGVAWFFAGAAALGLLLATGTWPVLDAVTLLPGTRSGDARRFLFLTAMALPVLAALGADRWLRGKGLAGARVACAVLAVLSLALFCVHLAGVDRVLDTYAQLAYRRHGQEGALFTVETFKHEVYANEAADNRSRLLATFARATLAAGAAFLCLRAKGKTVAVVVLTLVTIAELVHAGHGPVVAVPAARVDTPPAILAPALTATCAAQAAAQPRPRFQRLDPNARPTQLLQPNLGAFYGLEDLALYTSLAPRRLEELFDAIEPPRAHEPKATLGGAGVQALRDAGTLQHPLLDVLGLQFVLSAEPLALDGLVDRTPAEWFGPERLYERTTCAPRATFVTRVRTIEDRAERVRVLADRRRDAVHELILEEAHPSVPSEHGLAGHAQVRVLAWHDERITLEVDAPTHGFVRIADPFDAGWTARRDGSPTHLFVADHYLRAVAVPPGTHRIELSYDGPGVRWPPRLGLLGAALAVLVILIGCRPRQPRAVPA